MLSLIVIIQIKKCHFACTNQQPTANKHLWKKKKKKVQITLDIKKKKNNQNKTY